MRILITLPLILALSAQSASLPGFPGTAAKVRSGNIPAAVGGSACNTAADTTTGTTVSVTTDSSIYIASRFVAGSSYTSCKASLFCFRTGTLTGNWTLELWSHNSGANTPATLIASSGLPPTLGTTAANVDFTGLAASIVSGTTYWIVAHHTTGGTFGGTQFITTHEGTVSAGRLMKSPDGTAWTEVNTGVGLVATIYQ